MTKQKTLIRIEEDDVIIQMKVQAPKEITKGIEYQLRSIAAFLTAVDTGGFWPHFSTRWGRFISEIHDEFMAADAIRRGER